MGSSVLLLVHYLDVETITRFKQMNTATVPFITR